METVRERSLYFESTVWKGNPQTPQFFLTLQFAGGEARIWKGKISAPTVEDALRVYDRYQPGKQVELPARDLVGDAGGGVTPQTFAVGGGLVVALLIALVLFFVLPALWLFGVRNWFTHPARLALLFGLGALGGGGFLAFRTHAVQTGWKQVPALISAANLTDRVAKYGSEITMNDHAREYLKRGHDIASYEFDGVRYDYAMTYNRTAPLCQRGETCTVLVNPLAPWEIELPQPLDASTFAGALALAGMGLVFTLAGLFL